jgi:Flp pilus assembly protein TadG
MPRNTRRKRANSTIEFTLVGIPLIFTLISIFEMGRGMWIYHTMAYAIKEGTRYTVVHGDDCDPTLTANNCLVTIQNIAQRIKNAGIGLDQNQLVLTFTSASVGTHSCGTPSTLAACLADTTTWPPAPDNVPGLPIQISGKIPFQSAIAMFWPGKTHAMGFAAVNFPATSQETMEF